MATKTVRILVKQDIDEATYNPNDLVKLDAAEAKNRKSSGLVDDSKEAIAYCKTELGCEVIEHVKDEQEPLPSEPQEAPQEPALPAAATTETQADGETPAEAAPEAN